MQQSSLKYSPDPWPTPHMAKTPPENDAHIVTENLLRNTTIIIPMTSTTNSNATNNNSTFAGRFIDAGSGNGVATVTAAIDGRFCSLFGSSSTMKAEQD
jgi:hypothetical protein